MVNRVRGQIRQDIGFTLVELLIALSLMALLMGASYEVLRVARRSQRSAQDAVQLNQVARACLDVVRRDLESLVQEAGPYNTGLWAESGETSRDGAGFPGDYVTFLTASNVARIAALRTDPNEENLSLAADLIEVQYFVGSNPEEEGVGFVRKVKGRLNSTLSQEEEMWDTELLAEEVLGVNLRYWDGEAWQEEWDSETQEAYPEAVEVSLTVGRVFFEDASWSARYPDGRQTARKTFTIVVPLRMLPQEKLGAKAPMTGTVR